MKVIVGLGNAEQKYERTRHNLGFMVLDQLADKYELNFKSSSKFHANISEANLSLLGVGPLTSSTDEKVLLVKPTTMMNRSGDAIKLLQDFYKFEASDVLIVHDEIDLEFSQIRVKHGGGSAGHNGIKSVADALGEDFWRVRVGISNEKRGIMDAADFVLARFDQAEETEINHIASHAIQAIEDFLGGKFGHL